MAQIHRNLLYQMDMSGLNIKVKSVAYNVNTDLQGIINLNVNDALINSACIYALENVCNNRDKAFIIKSIADVCNIDLTTNNISYFLNASELLVLAVYIKDDIIDFNSIRGGKQALHLKFGTEIAILVSDIFFSLSIKEILSASKLISNEKLLYIVNRHVQCYEDICKGQIIGNNIDKLNYSGEFILSFYSTLVGNTYEYFCELPLFISECDASLQIKQFAQLCGLATQIRNDFEDIAGDKEKIDTELLMDIVYGRPNILIGLLFDNISLLNKNQISLISSIFGCNNKDKVNEEMRDSLFSLIEETSVLDLSLTLLVNICDNAISILNQFRDCEGKTNLINYIKHLKYD